MKKQRGVGKRRGSCNEELAGSRSSRFENGAGIVESWKSVYDNDEEFVERGFVKSKKLPMDQSSLRLH